MKIPRIVMRRGFLLGVFAFFVILLVVSLAVPAFVRGRVASVVEERLGLVATIDSVAVGFSGVELGGLHLLAPTGADVRIDVASLKLRANLLALAASGTSAVDGAEVVGASVTVVTDSAAFKVVLEKLRGAANASTRASGSSKSRFVHAKRVRIVLRDSEQRALLLEQIELDAEAGKVSGRAATLRIYHPRARAELHEVAMSGVRETTWLLQALEAKSADVTFIEPEPPAAAATPATDVVEDDAAGDAVPAKPKTPEPAIPATPMPATFAAAAPMAPWTRLVRHVARGAQITLRKATFRAESGSTKSQILHDAHSRLVIENEHSARIVAHGAAEGGGRLEIDMRVWPLELRADGTVVLKALPLTLIAPLLPQVPWQDAQNSRIDASLAVKAESLSRMALSGRAVLDHATIFSPRIAPTAVRDITVALEGKGSWLPLERRLEISDGRLEIGKSKIAMSGALELAADHYVIAMDASLPPTKCTDAVRSIPADLLSELAVAEWTGTLGGRVRVQVDSRKLDKTVLDVDVRDFCEFSSLPAMADLRRFAQPFLHSVVEPDDTVFELETGPGTEAWTPIEAISPFLIYAVLAHEDPNFFTHSGFSMLHVRGALIRNLEARRYVVGASTITMQLVKNVFLRREKTLARKLQEVLLTWWLERAMEKRDILELYLNVIEYGPSVYGIRAAAKHYFNRLPSELSPAEAVFLSTILPNPKRYHSFFERGALTPSWASTMRKQMQRMLDRGVYTREAAEYGLKEIDQFRFVPEGTAAAPRIVPGDTAPLPFAAAPGAGLGLDDDGGETFDASPEGYD